MTHLGRFDVSYSAVTAWLLVISSSALILINTTRTDPEDTYIYADQATYYMAAMSMAFDLDQEYTETDLNRFREMTAWDYPEGLFLKRAADGRYFYAKPFLYSALSAPLVRAFGYKGVIYTNALILCSILWTSFVLISRRSNDILAAVAVSGLLLFSPFYIYVLVAHADLFYALLLLLSLVFFWKYTRERSVSALLTTSFLAALSVYEKPFFAFAYLPFIPIATRLISLQHLAAATATIAATLTLTAAVYYNQDGSISPYIGERSYYASYIAGFPFDKDYIDYGWNSSASAASIFQPKYVLARVFANWANLPGQTIEVLFGRHTGLVPYFPFIVFAATLSIVSSSSTFTIASWAALAAYLIAYLLIFPENSYGGTGSFGSRYAMQAMPLVLLALISSQRHARSTGRRFAILAAVVISGCLGVYFMGSAVLRPFPMVAKHLHFMTSPKMSNLPVEYSLLDVIFRGVSDTPWQQGNANIYPVNYLSGSTGFPLTRLREQLLIVESDTRINEVQIVARTQRNAAELKIESSKDRITRSIPRDDMVRETIPLDEPDAIRNKLGMTFHYYRVKLSTDSYLFVSNIEDTQPASPLADEKRYAACEEYTDDSKLRTDDHRIANWRSEARLLLEFGWSSERDYTWSDGLHSKIRLPPGNATATGMGVEFLVFGFVNKHRKLAEVNLRSGDFDLGTWQLANGKVHRCFVEIPTPADRTDDIVIDLFHVEPLSPSSTNLSDDRRALNIAVMKLGTYTVED